MDHQVANCTVNGRSLVIETGEIAKQANGAALVTYGETIVFAAATASSDDRDLGFFPLTVDYRERTYAAGKIPGGFFKREGRPSEKETLTSRVIDRPIRPLFSEGYLKDTQVQCMVLSADLENDSDVIAIIAASAALSVSDIPFLGPVGAVRMGYVNGAVVVNPTTSQLKQSQLNMVVAGTRDAIVMVEGGATILAEDIILAALEQAHEALQAGIDLQLDLKQRVGKAPMALTPVVVDTELQQRVTELAQSRLEAALTIAGKLERQEAVSALHDEVMQTLVTDDLDGAVASKRKKDINTFMHDMESLVMRRQVLKEGKRADGRGLADIRPISGRTSVLPRSHGSSLFTRGETQALVVATLGTKDDEQMIDGLEGKTFRRLMLHYNFPSYSVGEVRPIRGPGRREIGHGALAERAIAPIIPSHEDIPYTIRLVSEIMESNGSSSMATVCGSSLALMDAGIPIVAPVAGIAMGLIDQDGEVAILSDILGVEDHLGDMDFKVAGTVDGITAIQMDIKTTGVSREVLAKALEQARLGRLHILARMDEILTGHRTEMSTHAPRITTLKVNRDKVRDIIGAGGKTIRGIIEQTGVSINVEDDGTVVIAGSDEASSREAIRIVEELTQEPEVGRIYQGKVRKIMDFGAFVEIFPGTDGLLHISQISDRRVNKVTDELQEGDQVLVKVLDVDQNGRIKLSHKEAVRERETAEISS